MIDVEVESKIKHILIEISRTENEKEIIEILTHSNLEFEKHFNYEIFPNAYNLLIKTLPIYFTKYFSLIGIIENKILSRINKSTGLIIGKLRILPDYKRLTLIDSRIFTVLTPWEEINILQEDLLNELSKVTKSIDVQKVGLISRVLMEKLSNMVFDPDKHISIVDGVDLSLGKYKNRLNAFIDYILNGKSNKSMRQLVKSSIEFVENAIDFMNTTTHKIDSKQHLAEVCVINTISALSIINIVYKNDENEK